MTDSPPTTATDAPHTTQIDYIEIQNSEKFATLRKSHRSFVFPLAIFFLVWYFAYVLLGAYAHDFMATPVIGNINIGLVLGLLQFVTTFAITGWYVWYANRKLDPQSSALRADLEAIGGEK